MALHTALLLDRFSPWLDGLHHGRACEIEVAFHSGTGRGRGIKAEDCNLDGSTGRGQRRPEEWSSIQYPENGAVILVENDGGRSSKQKSSEHMHMNI